MALFQRYKWAAAIVGILLTVAPLLWLTSWLQKQGEAEVAITAHWALGFTDLAIGETANTLNELAAEVDQCNTANLDRLRKALLRSGLIRELSLVNPSGQTQCTDNGYIFAERDVIASTATSDRTIMLDVVRIVESNERFLRVRRVASRRGPTLAALLYPSLLLPQVTTNGARFSGYASLTLADGSLVGTKGSETEELAAYDDRLFSVVKSALYGDVITVAMQRSGVFANYDDLRRIGMVVSGLIAVARLVVALIIPWRLRQTNSMPEIQRALAAGEFIPYYQPIIDITSGKLLGAEVLVRWKKPDGTIVSPGVFIPLVESSGLILDLTRSLMRHVCTELGPTLDKRPEIYVAFNIAPRHFKDSAVLNDVGAIFEGSPIRLSQVVLEVTERYELDNLNATRRTIAAIQALGCRIAIDDFGTGHSGLSYVLKLGVDIIKIDKLFVEAIKTDPQTQAVVKTLVDLAGNLQMKIIAEGVEHFDQVMYLREKGITAAQGFCFSPPVPGSIFVQLVQAMVKHPDNGVDAGDADLPEKYASAIDRVKAA